MQNKLIGVVVVLLIVAVGGFYLISNKTPSDSGMKGVNGEVLAATVYKSPNCGCCLGHAGYMKGEGLDVETIVESNMDSVKTKHNIPYNMQSCHTTEIEGYFVEGHIPIAAIDKLLSEKPPSGSPGMPGLKREEFIIYSLKDGIAEEFMRL